MDSAPLPPHERTWRHPSELAASAAVVEPNRQPRGFAIAGGALAVVLIATMFVALTPRQDTETTTAITATTIPSASALRDAAHSAVAVAESIRQSPLQGVTAIPNAIADVSLDAFHTSKDSAAAPAILPDLDDLVTVLTDQFVYTVAWRDVARVDLETDAVVVDEAGSIVARVDDGRLIVSHDLLVGASVSATVSASPSDD